MTHQPSENKTDPQDLYKKEIFNQFVEFFALPDSEKAEWFGWKKDGPKEKGQREVPGQKDFAQKYGVSVNTLTNWKKREEFVNAVALKRKIWGQDKTANVMEALYKRCIKSGQAYDVELFLAFYENWDRKLVIQNAEDKFSVDDIRALLAPLPKTKQNDFFSRLADALTEAELYRGSTESSGDASAESASDQTEVRT